MSAAWSPDGKSIAFVSNADLEQGELYTVPAEGGDPQRIMERSFGVGYPSWSPDSRFLVTPIFKPYSTRFREGMNYYNVVPSVSGAARMVVPALHQPIGKRAGDGPAWSPDGRQMAFVVERLSVRDAADAGRRSGGAGASDHDRTGRSDQLGGSHPPALRRDRSVEIRERRVGRGARHPGRSHVAAEESDRPLRRPRRPADRRPAAGRPRRRGHRRRGPSHPGRRGRIAPNLHTGHRRRRQRSVGDAGAHRGARTSVEGRRRAVRPGAPGVRHHDGPEPRRRAVRGRRRSRIDRIGSPNRAARVHDRLPAGRLASVLSARLDRAERGGRRHGNRAGAAARLRPDQDVRAVAGHAAEARHRGRAPHRHSDLVARDLPGCALRHRQRRAHRRDEPARLFAETVGAGPRLRGRDSDHREIAHDHHADRRARRLPGGRVRRSRRSPATRG